MLAIFGVFMVFSASHITALNTYNNAFFFGKKTTSWCYYWCDWYVCDDKVDHKFFQKSFTFWHMLLV